MPVYYLNTYKANYCRYFKCYNNNSIEKLLVNNLLIIFSGFAANNNLKSYNKENQKNITFKTFILTFLKTKYYYVRNASLNNSTNY